MKNIDNRKRPRSAPVNIARQMFRRRRVLAGQITGHRKHAGT
jgi:hypothetical protein